MPEAVKPKAAFCEDYNSDDNETLPGTRTVANVGARMRDSVKAAKPKESPTPASDSGYSSHTAATVGSTDSSKQRVASSSTKTSPVKRQRPALVQASASGSHRSSDKVTARTASRTESGPVEECSCSDCIKSEGTPSTPLDNPWNLNFAPFNTRPTIHYASSPSQPHRSQHPGFQEVPIIQTANARQRPASSNSYGRPASYHAPAMPDTAYYQYPPTMGYMGGAFPPPGSYHAQMNAYMAATSASTAHSPVIPPSPARTDFPSANPYDQGRRQWRSERYATRPSSVYGTPVVEYDQPAYGAPQMSRTSSAQEQRRLLDAPSEHRDRDEDYYRMPPPATIPNRRPSIRHSATTSSAREILRTETGDNHDAGYSDRSRRDPPEHSSRPRRPSLLSNDPGRKAASYMNSHGNARVSVEGPNRRRATYYGHEKARDLETKQKEIEAYQAAVAKSTPLTADALLAARQSRRSQSGSRSRASSSREGSELRTRSGSTVAQSDAGSFTMRFNAGAGVNLEFSGDLDGRTISLIPGEGGAPAELSIGRPRPRYIESSSSAQLEYARSVPRALEEGPGAKDRESRADRESLRSSRSGRS